MASVTKVVLHYDDGSTAEITAETKNMTITYGNFAEGFAHKATARSSQKSWQNVPRHPFESFTTGSQQMYFGTQDSLSQINDPLGVLKCIGVDYNPTTDESSIVVTSALADPNEVCPKSEDGKHLFGSGVFQPADVCCRCNHKYIEPSASGKEGVQSVSGARSGDRYVSMTESAGIYTRWTDRARKSMRLADGECQRLNHDFLGDEHILLGLVREGNGVACNILKSLVPAGLHVIDDAVRRISPPAPVVDRVVMGRLPHNDYARRVCQYANEEATQLNDNYVGTEHVLLGLLRVSDGKACRVLTELGVSPDAVRAETLRILGKSESR